MANNILELTDANFDSEIQNTALPVLVDFWAPWCGPCRMIAPLVEEIATEKAGALVVAKVNVDDSPETAAKFRIQAIPTLMVFRDGQVKEQITGMTSKSDLLAKVEAA